MNMMTYLTRTGAFARIVLLLSGAALAVTLVVVISTVVPSSQQAGASHSGWIHEPSEYHSGAHNSTHHMRGKTGVIGTTASYLYADIVAFHRSDSSEHGSGFASCGTCTSVTTNPVTFSSVFHSHGVIYTGCGKTSDGHILPNNGGPVAFHVCNFKTNGDIDVHDFNH